MHVFQNRLKLRTVHVFGRIGVKSTWNYMKVFVSFLQMEEIATIEKIHSQLSEGVESH
jgi:hypothetical protein